MSLSLSMRVLATKITTKDNVDNFLTESGIWKIMTAKRFCGENARAKIRERNCKKDSEKKGWQVPEKRNSEKMKREC